MQSYPDVLQLNLFPAALAARKVGSNSHVAFQGVNYSVPHDLFHSMVVVRATDSTIDILDSNGLCVASHKRCFVKRTYITDPSHMPPFYYSLLDIGCYDGAMLRKWAKHIGDKTYQLIDYLLSNKPIEQQAYKSCMAILQLSKKYGASRLNSACNYALLSGRCNFYAIRKFLTDRSEPPFIY
jgi:hypothetical protein